MPQQLLGTRPVFGLHEDAADEVPGLVRGARREQRVGRLRGDLKYRRHGFKLGPRRLFCEHLNHSAAEAPAEKTFLQLNKLQQGSHVSSKYHKNITTL